jgi:hypothetical protein
MADESLGADASAEHAPLLGKLRELLAAAQADRAAVLADKEAASAARVAVEQALAAAQADRAAVLADKEAASAARVAVEQARSASTTTLSGLEEAAKTGKATLEEALTAAKANGDAIKAGVEEARGLLSAVQGTNEQTKEVNAQSNAALASIKTLADSVGESASHVAGLKTQVVQDAQVAAKRSAHIEDGRKHVDEKRAEIDRLLNAAQQSATNAEGAHQASRTALQNLSDLYASAQTTKANADANAQAIADLLAESRKHEATTKGLASIADETDSRVKSYQEKLTKFEAEAQKLRATIESLLPGAASAGLAAAFHSRRAAFKWPQRIWQGVFVASILGLLGLASTELILHVGDAKPTWDETALSFLNRLPFALPLIWLAFHASHKAALAQRVEEDYAFKETVSRSFEGYRREMSDLEGKIQPDSPLAQLFAGVLGIVTAPPGRIYEKQPLNKTPLNAVAESAKPIAEAAATLRPRS